MMVKNFIYGAILLLGINSVCATSKNLEEAWEDGAFNGRNLQFVTSLYSEDDYTLSLEAKTALAESTMLINLRELDLHKQDIDDAFIQQICQNPTFSRIIRIDLSGNQSITENSLEYIFKSNTLGSIRDLPQISGRYGCPSSEVYLKLKGTNISDEIIKKYNQEPRFDFSIRYLHPLDNHPTFSPVKNSIKWLQIEKS